MADVLAKPPAPPANHDDEVVERRTLRDYYIILRERLWIALPLAVLAAVGYGYKKLQVTPEYAAEATMLFDKPETVVTTVGVVDQAVRSEVDLNTMLKQLDSNMLRVRVIESFKPEEQAILTRAATKRIQPGSPPPSVSQCLGSVSAFPDRNSLLIRLHVVHDDPEAAALVANRYLDEFMALKFDEAGGKNDEAIIYLKGQAERLKKDSEQKEQALQTYMKQKNMISLDNSQNLVADQLKRAAGYRDDAGYKLLAIEEKVKQIDAYKAAGKNLLEIPEIAASPVVAQRNTDLLKLLSDQNLLSERYLERHPKMIAIANSIDVTQQDLNRAIEATIADLRAQLNTARDAVATYTAEYAKAEKASLELRDLKIEYGTLAQQADSAKGSYMDVLKRLSDLETRKNVDKVPVHPLDKARVNPNPISPNKGEIYRNSGALFVFVFLGVAVGLSFIDDRIKSAWDVESFVGANLLGIIPDLASMKDDEKYTLLLQENQSPGVEAFLSVYSSIKIHSKLDFPKSILVTSTIPGEGKTLISCNVAGSFARHGKKTLLIDCDLRRPMMHRHFKLQNSTGLLSWFEAGAPLEGDLATNPVLGITKVAENLSLLSSGGRSKTPTELLEHPVFSQLLERLKKEYDLIIVDSPPLGAVTDSLLIAERVDEIVYVCRFNRAYRKHIRLYMRTLRNGKNEVLGIVLNGLSPRRIEYYSNYRYYRSYKKYYGAQT
ncbi:MAG TPA: polysaccharide biosynthesis tyrosine autokinase [Opitutaceae bacterium]|nr:polysaccharide biosynthesis tyrosine autokinase [Opitutaceae bacterium]